MRLSSAPRCLCAAVLVFSYAFVPGLANAQSAGGFGFEAVAERAKALAAKAFQPPEKIPAFLRELDYEGWRGIGFQRGTALWRDRGTGFEVQFYHPGLFYEYSVPIHVIGARGVKPVPFAKDRFVYPEGLAEKVSNNLGYAGFRLHYPIDGPGYKAETVEFLGASYFRAVSAGLRYGLSARGLAIDTALSKGEEFPYFKTFWIQEPGPDAEQITVYALLDSQSITGAFRYVITPGETTRMYVQSRLFARAAIDKLGIAPLTSMFMFGENQDKPVPDFRPEVHDSDGLLIATGSGERLWRPLRNPSRLTVNSFGVGQLRGFGLLQRDRRFRSYEDLDAHYERRPSVWIEPDGDWGNGRVELVQIPSKSERNDNIVAFWVPAEPVTAGQTLNYSYRMRWQERGPRAPAAASVAATRVGAPYPGSSDMPEAARTVVVDFVGGPLDGLAGDANVVPRVDAGSAAQVADARAYPNDVTGGWRLTFKVIPEEPGQPLELRAFLGDGSGGALSETWTYELQP